MNEIIPSPNSLAPRGALSEKALGFLDASMAENTRRSYESGWRMFVGWCGFHELIPSPATPETVAEYLAEMAEYYKHSTLQHQITVINQCHKYMGMDPPGANILVQKVMAGIAKRIGARRKKATPMMTWHLREIARELIAEDTISAKRDRALILIGFAGAFRRAELGSITIADVSFEKLGITIYLAQSKTDQLQKGETKGILLGGNPDTCPVLSLREWIDAGSITDGPVFQSFWRGGKLSGRGISGEAIRQIIKRRMVQVFGEDLATGFSGHSLRRGFINQGVESGVSEREMMRQTGHKSINTFRGYIDEFDVWEDNASGKLGL